MHRTPHTAATPKWNGVERLTDQPFVVNVRSGDLDGQRNTARVSQDMTFDALLGPIGGIGARQVPPLGAFTIALSRLHHCQRIPLVAS